MTKYRDFPLEEVIKAVDKLIADGFDFHLLQSRIRSRARGTTHAPR
jgi:hypothetical protein